MLRRACGFVELRQGKTLRGREREKERDGSGAAVVVRCCEGKGWSERWRSRDWKETDGGGRSGGGKGRARSHWVVVKWCPSLR